MRIRGFCYFATEQVVPYLMRDTDLVIDGQNYFFTAYCDSGLPYMFGAESDKYADYLRRQLQPFLQANIKCYFVLKGGHKENFDNVLEKYRETARKTCETGDDNCEVGPIFMKDIYKQVITEMGFQFCFSEFESKDDCIALARRLNCPILSNDIEFCFFGVPYVPKSELVFDEILKASHLKCGVFCLKSFMNKFKVNEDLLATFIVISDERVLDKDIFKKLLWSQRLQGGFNRFYHLLNWLSNTGQDRAMKAIFQCFPEIDGKKIQEAWHKTRELVDRRVPSSIAVNFLCLTEDSSVQPAGPQWFRKGVCAGFIPFDYVNLCHWKCQIGSHYVDDADKDALLITIDIIQYAFDLLTNYKNNELTFITFGREGNIEQRFTRSVEKPSCINLDKSVFEDGWSRLSELQLFEHFLNESLGDFNIAYLSRVPESVKIIMLALVYFTQKKDDVDTTVEVYSVLLSYIAFNESTKQIDSFADYFELSKEEEKTILDKQLLYSLIEFQLCLKQLNCLNILCGLPYSTTIYHNAWNGTLVYKLAYAMKQSGGNAKGFVEKLLKESTEGTNLFNVLIEVYGQYINK